MQELLDSIIAAADRLKAVPVSKTAGWPEWAIEDFNQSLAQVDRDLWDLVDYVADGFPLGREVTSDDGV